MVVVNVENRQVADFTSRGAACLCYVNDSGHGFAHGSREGKGSEGVGDGFRHDEFVRGGGTAQAGRQAGREEGRQEGGR